MRSALVRLYPRQWRERYGDELLALIEDSGTFGPAMFFDLLRGCAGAWVTSTFGSLSPRARQRWMFGTISAGSWGAGVMASAALTVVLPLHQIGDSRWPATLAVFGVIAITLLALFRTRQAVGLSPQIASFSMIECNALLATAVALGVVLHLPSLAAFRNGEIGFMAFAWSGAFCGLAFQPIGLSFAALLAPHSCRDLEPHLRTPSSTLGLGA